LYSARGTSEILDGACFLPCFRTKCAVFYFSRRSATPVLTASLFPDGNLALFLPFGLGENLPSAAEITSPSRLIGFNHCSTSLSFPPSDLPPPAFFSGSKGGGKSPDEAQRQRLPCTTSDANLAPQRQPPMPYLGQTYPLETTH